METTYRALLEKMWNLRDLLTYGGEVAEEHADEARALDSLMMEVQDALSIPPTEQGKVIIPTREEMEDEGIEWSTKAPIEEEAEGVAFVGWESCYTWMVEN